MPNGVSPFKLRFVHVDRMRMMRFHVYDFS